MDVSTMNWLALIVATIAGFAVGGFWYSTKVFGKPWMEAVGLSEEDPGKGDIKTIMIKSFVLHFIMALFLAMVLNAHEVDAAAGAGYGFFFSFGWVFFAITTNSMYEGRPFKYALISGGHWVVAFTIMGLILGAWQ